MIELQTIAKILAGHLLNSTAEGILLTFLFWVLLRIIGRQEARTRFASWFSVLLAIVALPFFDWSRSLHSSPTFITPHFGLTLSTASALFLFTAWAVVAGLLLLRLSLGLWRVRCFRERCSEVDPAALEPPMAEVLRKFVSHHRIKVCVSANVTVPSVMGFFRPAIIFPVRLLPRLSAEELAVILPHELAHLRRLDQWTNLVQKLVRTLFFFHPAVWWIDQRLTLEREVACDDVVLEQRVSPRTYASLLISLAEKLQNARGLELVQALVTRTNQMSLRVAQILDEERPGRLCFIKPLLSLSAGLLIIVSGTAPCMPQLVAFEPGRNRSPQALATSEQSQLAAVTDSPIATPAVPQPALTPAIKAVRTAFNPRNAGAGSRLKVPSRMPHRRAQPNQFGREILVVLQSTPSETSSRIRVLCIWKMKAGSVVTERQMGSAIVISLT